ncbi:MAG: endopeptidase La [Bacteroidota bacterium]
MLSFHATSERSEEVAPLATTLGNTLRTHEDHSALLPLLTTKQDVLFPGVIMPTSLQQEQAKYLAKEAYRTDSLIGVVAQKSPTVENPTEQDIFHIGTMGSIISCMMLPDGRTTAILQGQQRFQVTKIIQKGAILWAHVRKLSEKASSRQSKTVKALIQSIKEVATKLMALQPALLTGGRLVLDHMQELNTLTYFLAASLQTGVEYQQKLLATHDSTERGNLLLKYLLKELEMSQLSRKLQDKLHQDINQQQRDYYIRNQIKVLQDELGEDEADEEIAALRAKGKNKRWPAAIADSFYKELNKAERLSPHSHDYPVILNHAELLLELPWEKYTQDNTNLQYAAKVLNADHHGIEKVKERLLEYLAVLQRKQSMKAPILCLYGPPGVGKTSLGKSIAKAMRRKYTRISLGGVHDEAEIKGHRKTYVGAMPGKLIKGLQKAGSSNPVFMLDELDKLSDWRGDPAAALLEVLDPEQNNAFVDNFLEVPYDLSQVLFIATANTLDTIPQALKDRLEVIELTGYTVEEKLQIAKKYLFPKQRKEHGLKASHVGIHDSAIVHIIEHYTRESGVRELARKLGSLVRKVAKAMALDESYPKRIKKIDITKLLGVEKFDQETYQHIVLPGVAIGLAWTPVGGEILFIESTLSQGKGKLTLSGQLGKVMKESAVTALTYLKAHAASLGIAPQVFNNYDLHIHIPAGAVPKDGPSAGITLLAALASLYTQRKVRSRLAMTGEITLRGRVLPVGGIQEKILAAKRAGVQEIILSAENKKDIQEINHIYIEDLTFHYAHNVPDVLKWALQAKKAQNARKWDVAKVSKARRPLARWGTGPDHSSCHITRQ